MRSPSLATCLPPVHRIPGYVNATPGDDRYGAEFDWKISRLFGHVLTADEGKYLSTPSCITVASGCPDRSKKCPAPSPRESAATGDDVEYNTQSLKLTCR